MNEAQEADSATGTTKARSRMQKGDTVILTFNVRLFCSRSKTYRQPSFALNGERNENEYILMP